jgi:hypothetical protein
MHYLLNGVLRYKNRMKKIINYDKYFITQDGRIFSSRGEKRQSTHSNGYKSVSLWSNNKEKRMLVHRLVAQHFIGDVTGLEVNHIDFDKGNNNASNLEIVTKSANMYHARVNKRFKGNLLCVGDKNPSAKLTESQVIEILKRRNEGAKTKDICKEFPIKKSSAQNIFSGKTWKHIKRD